MKSYLFALILLAAPAASASYLAIGESGEIAPVGDYKLGLAPQLLLNDGGGANVGVFMDAPLTESTSLRGMAGAGEVDFHVGASAKYIPFPDVDNQPAIGGRVALWYAREGEINLTTIQLAPLISRKMNYEGVDFTPYVAIPVNITSASGTGGRNVTGTQFVVGSEWAPPESTLMFTGELAINLNDSYSALTFSLALPIDESRGIKGRRY